MTSTSIDLPGGPPSLENSAAVKAIEDIAFGSVAGAIGKVLEYPFDTIKVRLQSSAPSLHPSAWACFTTSLREGGLPSLYRGISAPLIGAAVETSSLFWSYRIALQGVSALYHSKDAAIPPTEDGLPLLANFACGAASGAFTSLLLTPIELIKCQMQVPTLHVTPPKVLGSLRQPGPFAVIASIYHHRGILGFWHGQFGTLIRETGGSAAWFGSYESIAGIFLSYKRDDHPKARGHSKLLFWQQLLAGAAAGMSYNFIFFPADTVKSRMQTAAVEHGHERGAQVPHQPLRFWSTGAALWHEQGLKGLYRGCGITVARSAPSSAFIFLVFEELKGRFGS